MENDEIIEINENKILEMINELPEKNIIVLKFTAAWCGPCKKIHSTCEKFLQNIPESIKYYEIDIDDSIELYMKLKKNKMVNGIPALLAYYPIKKEKWFIPDDSHLGSDINELNNFFNRCLEYVK